MGQQEFSDKEEIERLLKIALTGRDENVAPSVSDVDEWMRVAGVKAGDTYVDTYQVYYTYRNWSINPVDRRAFTTHFRKFFPRVRVEYNNCYKLDPTPFDFSEETKWLINKERRESGNKEKQDEVSGTDKSREPKDTLGTD